jgi:hypothetical protein
VLVLFTLSESPNTSALDDANITILTGQIQRDVSIISQAICTSVLAEWRPVGDFQRSYGQFF